MMRIKIRVSTTDEYNIYTDAASRIFIYPDGVQRRLDIDLKSLHHRCTSISEDLLDLLITAGSIYCADKGVSRSGAKDNWTRDITIQIPVRDPTSLKSIAPMLNGHLNFLTGDNWDVNFVAQGHPHYKRGSSRKAKLALTEIDFSCVCLFSGGLDSTIGAINWLEENGKGKLLCVGHYDGNINGPSTHQSRTFEILKKEYPGRVDLIKVRVGQRTSGLEVTLRSRSFMFLALGLTVANSIGSTVPLLIPENSTIALNCPLTPSRRGTCSTRTAHPQFLNDVSKLFQALGFENPILNPHSLKTKGEVVQSCLNQKVLRKLATKTNSCAKSNHRRSWIRRDVESCGRCMPCLYRRAALSSVGLDNGKQYGTDICRGELDLNSRREAIKDVRAFLYSMLSSKSLNSIFFDMRAVSGGVGLQECEVVQRAADEVRTWLVKTSTIKGKSSLGI